MTIEQLFEKYNLNYTIEKKTSTTKLYQMEHIKLLIWINDCNIYKMDRKWYEELTSNTENFALLLVDKSENQYYYLKFNNKTNWFSDGFNNSDKKFIFLGKQVLNYKKTLKQIIADLVNTNCK